MHSRLTPLWTAWLLAVAASSAAAPWRALTVPLPAEAVARAAGLEPQIEPYRLVHEVSRRCFAVEGDLVVAARRSRDVRAALLDPALPRRPVTVPVPLPEGWWRSVLEGPAGDQDLVNALLGSRRAGLLYRGLVQLDEEALDVLAAQPRLARFVRDERPEIFSVVAPGLRLRNGRVLVPGGESAEGAWARAVGASPGDPPSFLRRLLERDEGRLAFLFHVLQHLDPPRQRWVLGTSPEDAERRLADLRAVCATEKAWWVPGRPTAIRPLLDSLAVLSQALVTDTGELAAPAGEAFWEAVFSGGPTDAERLRQGGTASAAWLARQIARQPVLVARTRWLQLGLAQRLFAAQEDGPTTVEALRQAARRPALALTLERMGISAPGAFLELHLAAERADRTDGRQTRLRTIALFEGALAILDAAHHRGALDRTTTAALAGSLAALPIGPGGYGEGAFAAWVEARLLPALRDVVPVGPEPGGEDTVLRAVAGMKRTSRPRIFDWEGLPTRVDPAEGAYLQLRRVRARQGGPTLDEALGLVNAARDCAATQDAAIGQTLVVGLRTERILPWGLTPAEAQGLQHEPRLCASGAFGRLAEASLAGVLVSLAYAPHLGPAEGAVLSAGSVALRHDLEASPFALPEEVQELGAPWRVRGSLLALETAIARLSLRRTHVDLPSGPPCLGPKALAAFARSAALRSPAAMSDGDLDGIVSAVARGRARAADLRLHPALAPRVATDAGLDPWRSRLLPWLLAHQPEETESFFTLAELSRLGGGAASSDGWGLPLLGGGLVLRRPWPGLTILTVGQDRSEVAAALYEEPILRVGLILAERRLPATLAPSLLGLLTQAIADDAPATTLDDPLALARWLRSWTAERWDDTIAALAGRGPLLPAPDLPDGGSSGPFGAH